MTRLDFDYDLAPRFFHFLPSAVRTAEGGPVVDLDDQYREWCAENLSGSVNAYISQWRDDRRYSYWLEFEHESEAILFKMRWF